jgi:hypothetical protein
MTVKQLIARLSQMPSTAEVKSWDADSEEFESVTGLLWDPEVSCLYLQTDDIS